MTKADQIEIKVTERGTGKHLNRKNRSEKQVPAVVYGPKIGNFNFCLEEKEIVKYSKREYENSIFVLKSDSSNLNNLKVLKKAVDYHPVSHRPIHLDFYALDMTQTVKVNIEIKFTGKPEGVREGGVFNVVAREVEVECLPIDIPEHFEIDTSEMKMHDVLHVSDLNLPEGMKILTSEELTIATVAEPAPEEEVAPVVAEGAEGEAAAAGEGGEAKAEGGEAAPAEGDKKSD